VYRQWVYAKPHPTSLRLRDKSFHNCFSFVSQIGPNEIILPIRNLSSGEESGTRLVVKESSAGSLGSFFRWRGGEVEDYLVLLLDLTNRETTVYIGDEDLLDDFQTDEESIDTPQISEFVS